MEDDMTLGEFMGLVTAREEAQATWVVTVPFKDGSPDGDPVDITVNQCQSEFDAKERVFLYLKERIRQEVRKRKEQSGKE